MKIASVRAEIKVVIQMDNGVSIGTSVSTRSLRALVNTLRDQDATDSDITRVLDKVSKCLAKDRNVYREFLRIRAWNLSL